MVLAAGRGERFGGRTKQREDLHGRPLVAHAVAAARGAGMDRVVVVVGHDGDAVAQAVSPFGDVQVVDNPRHAEGQSTSLVAGIRALMDPGGTHGAPGTADGTHGAPGTAAVAAVVLLADQPGVSPAAVRTVADTVLGGAVVARARYADGPGHPIAFHRSCWPALLAVTGDAGARQLLGELDVTAVPVAGPAPQDVDTPEDLERLRRPDPE